MKAGSVRTSSTHPITLSKIVTWKGSFAGLCYCPGKVVIRDGIQHKRNLQQDLLRLKQHFGVTCIVCLLNTAELRSFHIKDYAGAVQQAGLTLLTFEIIEMAAPQCIHKTYAFIQQLTQLLAEGQNIAIHCRGGVGRAGLIAACLLLHLQEATSGKDAIRKVRQRRCKAAIETAKQEDFVSAYACLCQSTAVMSKHESIVDPHITVPV